MLVYIDENEYHLRAINIAIIQNHNQQPGTLLCGSPTQVYRLASPPCCEVQSQTT